MDEMIEDVMNGMDDEELEDEAEDEVEIVLFEITNGLLGQAGKVGTASLEKERESQKETLSIKQLNSI